MKWITAILCSYSLCFFLSSCGSDNNPRNPGATENDRAATLSCTSSGGHWETFPTSCTDRCSSEPREICATVLTEGCNCGEGRCYLDGHCVDNPSWHVEE